MNNEDGDALSQRWKLKKVPAVNGTRPYMMQELCNLYGISDKTMRKWLKPFQKELGKRHGHRYTVRQVEIIFQKLGIPARFEESAG